MRYRDFCCIALVMMLVVFASGKASQTIRGLSFASVEINREDANRKSSTILSSDVWVEYQIQSDANSIRLLTNVALDSRDAPDHDLDNPRTGWRYSVNYELLDENRTVFKKATYHFRSQVHQLMDVESGEAIYPIFFGKSSLVATQTRVMQLPINRDDQRVAILRVKVSKSDPKIHEVVSRVLVRREREDYDKRTTWNRMSTVRREGLSRFCVYGHDLLTISERNNLLRWQWKSAPVISQFKKRYLFFIGDIDDQQVRGDQLPAGLFVDKDWLGTIPVPETSKNVRLEFRWVERTEADESKSSATIQWTGANAASRAKAFHTSGQMQSEVNVSVDGGLLQIRADRPVVVRAFVPAADLPAEEVLVEGAGEREIGITPDMNFVRTFLTDSRAVQYGVTHIDNQPTPLRLIVRYPYAQLFSNLGNAIGDELSSLAVHGPAEATWEFLRQDGSVIDRGELEISTLPSAYDRFTVAGKRELISNPNEFFFSVPVDVSAVRIASQDYRVLVSAYVRPMNMRNSVQIPEDYHAYNRITSTRRTWYSINPTNCESLIQDNRSFIVQSQSRPAEPNDEVLAGRYEWERFVPVGNWVARSLLVPQAMEAKVRESAIQSIYYELPLRRVCNYSSHSSEAFADFVDTRIAFVSDDHPGRVSIDVNGVPVYSESIRSARGEISLDNIDFGESGTLEIKSENDARFFLVGKEVPSSKMFLRRSAQRLKGGYLDFQYEKTSEADELVTLQLFRPAGDSQRCRVHVDIEGVTVINAHRVVLPSWTLRQREYDLRAQAGHDSILLGHSDQVDQGYRCFIRLGNDLPAGKYQIKVRCVDGDQDAYALLYRVVPGERPRRSIQVESAGRVDHGY